MLSVEPSLTTIISTAFPSAMMCSRLSRQSSIYASTLYAAIIIESKQSLSSYDLLFVIGGGLLFGYLVVWLFSCLVDTMLLDCQTTNQKLLPADVVIEASGALRGVRSRIEWLCLIKHIREQEREMLEVWFEMILHVMDGRLVETDGGVVVL